MASIEDVKAIGEEEVVAEAAAETTTEPAEVKEKEVKVIRIIDMEDGTKCNFGVRNNLVTNSDSETGILTFKISTGQILTFLPPELEGLNKFQKDVFLYGILSKVKTSLAPVKPLDLAAAISVQLDQISKKEFNVRNSGDSEEVLLTEWQKAFALVVSETVAGKEHWKNLEDGVTITEVLTSWNEKTVVQRNNIKRHPLVMQKKVEFDLASEVVDMEDLFV